ncbi:TldD/PmbA family protein [Roseomonas marmotae]|uniref:TldD/PmbA family protein n=1 Tax=Roseomonas marmotae TaxID=2768161 RepID=A0ABS3K7W6_9PROT|nr:TldD/PmbA family protein [Roseomonas marmotae]MBO1073557.1 TldD/PmbA family protein [Roseomonas marmotae]QTI80259.1 TldD/PmbA family protein [Roseomonas marmotae]
MNNLEMLEALVAAARAAGADAADAILAAGTSLSVSRRLGATEHLERAEGFDLGLRVFIGQRQAIVSSTDPDPAGFAQLAERAVVMARAVPEDRFSGLPEAVPLPPRDLDLDDPAEPSAQDLLARAAEAEEAALATAGVTNSNGADAGFHRTRIAILGSNGFAGEYARSSHSISVSAVAGQGTAMERDYDHSVAVHLADLEDAASLGRSAGARAVRRLNPTRPASRRLSVVYDPRVAGSLLGYLAGALNGASVARGTSFLRDSMGKQVLAPGLTLRDDPLRRRGLRSRPFDGEGMPGEPRALIEDGVLRSWVLDWRSARQLGLTSTGHASRGISGPPSPSTTNLWLEPGKVSPAALMSDLDEALYVTEMMGSSVNAVTGDYSRGASGFMIRKGELAEPVSGITIAGNLKEMYLHMAAADDLRFRRGTDAPTLRVDGMTLAGA